MTLTVAAKPITTILISFILGLLLLSGISYFAIADKYLLKVSKPHEAVKNVTGRALIVTNFTIVLYVVPHWMNHDHNAYISKFCEYRNCRVTNNRTNLRRQSAILFVLSAAPPLPHRPPISQSERYPDQAWVFMWYEAPIRHRGNFGIYKNKYWRNTANWTASFSDNADIVHPLGHFEKRTPPIRNYSEIFHRKNKTAAWLVSNCKTPSRREDYVKKLRSQGIEIDIYGRCGGKRAGENNTLGLIETSYKFYFSFENSLCKDYITEKFYKYYKLDVVLVVRGGGNYTRKLADNAYINTEDFTSTAKLAAYLKEVASSEQLYTKYLRNKDKYESIREEMGRSSIFCGICKKLNNLKENRKVHTNLLDIMHKGQCKEPKDIV